MRSPAAGTAAQTLCMSFACLYMPDFVLQANLRGAAGEVAEQDGAAVALIGGPSSCPRVIAATRKAREAGVMPGMTRSEAAPFASIRQRSQAQEDSAHAALMDCALSCSPRVEDTAADTVVLDLDGMEKLLGSPPKIARRLLAQAKDAGLNVHAAIACNPDVAILAARGFRGATIIPPGEEARMLADLPVSILNPQPEAPEVIEAIETREAPETIDTLRLWGIRYLKELALLPPLPLSERLGQEGVHLQKLARGGHTRALRIAARAERFEEGWELEDAALTLDELDFVLSSLLARLSKRLAMRSLATQEMRLRMNLDEGMEPEPSLALEETARESKPVASVYERSIRFPLPVCDAKLFFKLWRLRLESDPPQKPVVEMRISAEPAKPRPTQGGLFAPLAPDPERLELTLARIAAVVGSGNVGSPELADTHKPHAFHMAAFNPAESNQVDSSTSQFKRTNSGEGFVVMALRIFRPPAPIRVEVIRGSPARVFSSQVRGKILFAAGPWRKSGGWWEDEEWDREEWDVELRTGGKTTLYSIYHDLLRDEWRLQGEYD